MENKQRLKFVIDFIVNHSTDEEMDFVRSAVERRCGVAAVPNIDSLDFGQIAQKLTADLKNRFNLPESSEINSIARRMVKNIIREHEPNISDIDLETLLDKWTPRPGQEDRGKENELPLEALMSMVDQFVAYSTGRLSKAEQLKLKKEMPNWPEKYWEIFAPNTKILIAEHIRGKFNLKTFWTKFQEQIRQKKSRE